MNFIREICKEPCFRDLQIKEWTSLDLIKRVGDLLEGKAFKVYIEKLQGEKLEIIVRPDDDLNMVWKAICSAFGKLKIGVSKKNLQRRYDLWYKDRIFEKYDFVETLGICEYDVLKFKRKLFRGKNSKYS